MTYKNSDVVEHFLAFGTNEKIHSKSVFFEKDVLFSYGYHFPLCIRLKNGFLVNSDGYSNTTARHKGLVKRGLRTEDFKLLNTAELKTLINENENGENFKFLTYDDIIKKRVLKELN